MMSIHNTFSSLVLSFALFAFGWQACSTPVTQKEQPKAESNTPDASTKDTVTPTDTQAPQDKKTTPDPGPVDRGAPDLAKDTNPQPEKVADKPVLPEKSPDKGTPPVGNSPVLHGCKIFPEDNPWNKDISKEPVDPNSQAIVASIGAGTSLHPDFGTVWDGAPNGIPYVVVGPTQKGVKVTFEYADESDKGPYPIPANAPIEGGPKGQGDRHVLILQTTTCKLFELFSAFPQADGSWKAGSGAIFDLNSNKLRPEKWTSADAAGLPILPGLIRYEEVMSGEIKHALRFTVSRSRKAYVHPATHWASSRTDANLPPMGARFRLKASFNISTYSKNIQVILRAMKKYGMFMADNGSNWYISGAPNPKWSDDELRGLKKLKGGDFELVEMGKIYTP